MAPVGADHAVAGILVQPLEPKGDEERLTSPRARAHLRLAPATAVVDDASLNQAATVARARRAAVTGTPPRPPSGIRCCHAEKNLRVYP